mgnify:CR=1 FL=1
MPHTSGGMRWTLSDRRRPPVAAWQELHSLPAQRCRGYHARSPIPGRASPVTPFCDPCQAFAGRRRRSSVSEAAACGTVLATVVPNHMAVRHFKQDKSDETRPRSLVFERVLAACRDWHSYAGSGVFAGVAGDGPRRGNHVRPNHRRTSLKQSPSSCFTQKIQRIWQECRKKIQCEPSQHHLGLPGGRPG